MSSKLVNFYRKRLGLFVAILMVLNGVLSVCAGTVSAADEENSADADLPQITQVTDDAGFIHPGVGLTKALLENVRTKIRAGAQPWTYYYNTMLLPAPEAAKTVTSSNSSNGTTPSADNFDSQGIQGRFIADAVKAYAQAMMYFITGDEVYRANAMMIIRIWEQMDPAKYAYYTDAHIHAGVPLNRMVMAAEIMRYTSTKTESLAWTDQDTAKFTDNLIVPVTETLLHDQNHFMNQHTYPILGAMAGYIFTGNKARYDEAVEWFTVNRTAKDQGFNGSIKALFRWVTEEEKPGQKVGEGTPVEPRVQHMEMGRDQAHGGGDLTNAAMITRLIHAQGTRIDPVAGTPSTADNAVDIMAFLNDRMLGAANYFWQFMLGYDTPWTPQAYAITGGDPDQVGLGGTIRDTYNFISPGYRGRFDTANFWDFYSYYTYERHEDVSLMAPYYYEAFTKKQPSTPGAWSNKDAGNDFWLYLPPEAEADAAKFIPQDQTNGKILQLEDRYTKLDEHTTFLQEGDTRFIRFEATQEGSKIAALSFARAAGSGLFGFRIRTDGVSALEAMNSTFTLPDTHGEWKYVSIAGTFGDIVYMTVKGAPGVTVDIDSVDAGASASLTPPVFKAGSADLKIYTYIGASVNVDLSATDANSADTIAYELQNNAKGLPIDARTGLFSWQPAEAGSYSVVAAATDGTAVSVKNVSIVVSGDRASAVQAIIAAYDKNQVYVEATLNRFKQVYNDTLSRIDTASETEFDQQLQALRAAADGLELVTPVTDFGIRWSKVVAWSSWGSLASNMDDGTNLTGAGYGLALGSAPHLYHLLDFGPDYKVSVTKFGFLSNIFVDRLANSTVYGSNDKMNWTRLTPGVTQYTQAYHTLDVDPAYQNNQYRYIKLEMIKPLPAVLYGEVVNLLELTDFDVYGTRHEVGNQLQSVSLSSDQALNGRVALGNTVKVSVTAKEAVQDVKVKIQGQDAAVSSTDRIHWMASAVLKGEDQTGDVLVSVDYTKQDGTNGDTLYGTTDGSKLFAADESDLIENVAGLANLAGFSAADTLKQANYLFDNNPGTNSEFRLNGSGAGSYMTFDFKEGNQVTLSSVELLARQDSGLFNRISGAVVQGSNDNTTWTTLTKAAVSTADWQMLKVGDTTAYRYIRIYNANTWYGNMAELRLHGVVKSLSQIASASISSAQSLASRIVPGSTVKLAFTAKEEIHNVKVAIQGLSATVASEDGIHWTAEAKLNPGTATGPVQFAITYDEQDGTAGFPIHTTTDNSALFLVDETDVIQNVAGIADLIDSTSGRTAAQTLQQVNYLFDGIANTGSDFRIDNNSGKGSFIIFDFKEGHQAALTSVELLARNLYDRIRGTVVQGSNDKTTWTTLTSPAESTPNWQTFAVSDKTSYRYIKMYNAGTWYGNMAELRFHGAIKAMDDTEPPAAAELHADRTAPTNEAVTVTISYPADAEIKEFKVGEDGEWTGYAAPVTIADNTTVYARSADAAGNVSEVASYTVGNIDRTPPQIAIAGETAYTIDRQVQITCQATDAGSGVASSTCDTPLVDAPAYTLEPGTHTVQAEATDAAGNSGSSELTYSVFATIDSLSALTGSFMETTGASGWQGAATALQAKLSEAKAKTEAHRGAEARELLQAYIDQVNAQSGAKLSAEQAETLAHWAQRLSDATPLAGDAPGKPALSDDNGYDTGLKDGSYKVSMNLWWGNNATAYKLYENGVLVDTQTLSDRSPQSQKVETAIAGKANGTYTYTCELTNAFGTTACDPLVVDVTDASPGKPVLSHNNWDGDGDYDVTMNLWWGTNGTEYRLYENGKLIDTLPLTGSTPSAQHAVTSIAGRTPGVYEYRGVLVNAAGETSSETITVTVKS